MPALGNTSALKVELERVRGVLPLLYEVDDTFINKLKKNGENIEVSYKNLRMPFRSSPGGRFRYYDSEAGAMGRGTGTNYEEFTATPLDVTFAVEFTDKAKKGTNSKVKAVQNLVKRETTNAMQQFKSSLDKQVNASATGVLGVIEALPGGNVFTLTNPRGAQLFYQDQVIQVYDTTLATNRGSAVITLVNRDLRQITVDATPGSTATTDVLVAEGLSGATPVTLRSIYHFQSDAATGTLQGLNRANFPQIRTSAVNAANAALTTGPLRLALDKVLMRLGVAKGGSLSIYWHLAQEHAYEQLGIQISDIIKEGGNQGFDRMFGGKKTVSGVPTMKSINADPSRIDFLDMSEWGRGVVEEVDFRTDSNGDIYYTLYSAAPGGILAAEIFYYVTSFQVVNFNPGAGSFVHTLAVPTGYLAA